MSFGRNALRGDLCPIRQKSCNEIRCVRWDAAIIIALLKALQVLLGLWDWLPFGDRPKGRV
jgi:hypothetical protein